MVQSCSYEGLTGAKLMRRDCERKTTKEALKTADISQPGPARPKRASHGRFQQESHEINIV